METPARTLITRYRLEQPIGRGGMATVYHAWDERLCRSVAVKVLADAYAADVAFVERFKREARAMASLAHPNIVAVYDWGQSDDAYFMVMEYVSGQTLRSLLTARGPLPEAEVRALGAQIAAALAVAHAGGIIHRDIKPHNLLVSDNGHVKVTDFGIARVMGDSPLTLTQAVMGTAQYLSPEQVLRDPVDARADLYSLGIVLYELLTGAAPFTGDSLASVALQHVQAPVPPLHERRPDVSPEMEAIIRRATEKDPAQRYPTAEALGAALAQAPERAPSRVRASGTRPLTLPVPVSLPLPVASRPPTRAMTPGKMRRAGWLAALPLVVLLALFLRGQGAFTAPSLEPVDVLAEGTNASAAASPVMMAPHRTVTTANVTTGIFSALNASAPPTNVAAPPATPLPLPTATPLPAPTATTAATATAVPAPTQVPTPVPPTAPAPTATPAARIVARAARPQDAVLGFYQLVTAHQFDVATALWSPQLQAQQPPAQAINTRYAQTERIAVQHWEVTAQTADRATVVISVSEYTQGNPTPKNIESTWQLVHTDTGWLLDAQQVQPA